MTWMTEAVAQWTYVNGAERPDAAWLLSPYDTWERNPCYHGPAQAHPEEEAARQDAELDAAELDADDNPF